MDETFLLKLPYIIAAQSQKHVTHNEALRALDAIVQLAVADKDLSAPPGAPAEGSRYIVGGSATGAWAGHTTHVAAWQDGAWAFYVPVAGWLAWVDDESQSYLYSGGGWIPAPGGGGASLVPKGAWSAATTYATGDLVEHEGSAFLSNVDANLNNEPDAGTPGSTSAWTYFSVVTGGGGGGGGGDDGTFDRVGVNATADTTNRLSVSSPATLLNHEGAGHQLKINKASAGQTGSVLFQTGFSARAEFGLAGDDDFHVKVSADGSAWHEAIVVNRATGHVSMPNTPQREMLSAARTYYVRTNGNDSNTGLANNAGGAFLTIQKAVDTAASLDLGIHDVTINVGAGTYAENVALKALTGAGRCYIVGDETTPTNVVIAPASGICFAGDDLFCTYGLRGMALNPASSGTGIRCQNYGKVLFRNLSFGGTSTVHMTSQSGGLIEADGNWEVTAGANFHMSATGGVVDVRNRTVTLTGTPAFGTAGSQSFASAIRGGGIIAYGNTFTGSATGRRYFTSGAGWIDTNGGGANYFPGNAAGSSTFTGYL